MTRYEKIILLPIIVLLCASIYTHFVAAGIGDTEMMLAGARKLADGECLYHDVFTVNPPLIYWLYMLPVELARLFGLSDLSMMVLTGLGLAGVSIAVCDRVLASHPAFARNRKARMWHALLLGSVFITSANPAYFFDREHIFLMLVFPYLLRFMPTLSDKVLPLGLKLAVGCMAAIGFCIKPHCAIVFAAVQLLYMARTHTMAILFSIENSLIYAIGSLYMASIFVFTPDYVWTVLPMALVTYSAVGQRINGLFFSVAALVILGIAFADFRWRLSSPYRRDIYYLLGLCPAFLLYALANNGWNYTYLPLISLTLVVAGWVWMEYLWLKQQAQEQGLSVRQCVFGARACALILAVFIGGSAGSNFFEVSISCTQHLKCSQWGREIIAVMNEAHSFGTISGDLGVWPRLSDTTGARWDTRFNHLWMLPKFLASDKNFERQHYWILAYVADALADDMERRKPDIMFVDAFSLAPGSGLETYFSAFPRFREAWRHYRYLKTIQACDHPEKAHCGSFKVYERVP